MKGDPYQEADRAHDRELDEAAGRESLVYARAAEMLRDTDKINDLIVNDADIQEPMLQLLMETINDTATGAAIDLFNGRMWVLAEAQAEREIK